MSQPKLINVQDLVPVPNVCDQELREIISLPSFSLAHVIMKPGNVSLWHEHRKMTEIYYILSGNGIVYHGDEATLVEKGAYVVLPKHTPHKLENTCNFNLEHLVFAIPPFNPDDVYLLNDSSRKTYRPKNFEWNQKSTTALDGATVYELITKSEEVDIGLAVGYLPGRRKAIPHYHKISEELYYILDGEGNVKVGEQTFEVKKNSAVYIPTNQVHAMENFNVTKELTVLCVSSPAYVDGDFILVE